ncbi:MAG: lytic transglycosylase domain-containing protein [Rhizobiaceae bacterium]
MRALRLFVIAGLMPFGLAACQNTMSTTNNYGGDDFNKPVTGSSGLFSLAASNEAASKAGRLSNNSTGRATVESRLLPANESLSSATPAVAAATKLATTKKPLRKLTPKEKLADSRKVYGPLIAKHAKQHGVPVKLAMAVVQVESNYRPEAVGKRGEIGLMQLLPQTARYIGYDGKMKQLHHPDTNIRYGMKYLGKAYKLGGGTTCGTILKYNAGHGAKRMNKVSRHYCARVQQIMRQI